MSKPTVIIVTGHPAAGKTTLAHRLAQEIGMLLIWKDQIKESLFDSLGADTVADSRRLGRATWDLLYLQIENLLKARLPFIVEGNFEPQYATPQW
ncbi:MAG: AAA family ATPase, partial [Chloroflexota bacterium]